MRIIRSQNSPVQGVFEKQQLGLVFSLQKQELSISVEAENILDPSVTELKEHHRGTNKNITK